MKKMAALALCLLMSGATFAGGKHKCKKKHTQVSCADIEGAKREYFCAKGKVSAEKTAKRCKTEMKKGKAKKIAKKLKKDKVN